MIALVIALCLIIIGYFIGNVFLVVLGVLAGILSFSINPKVEKMPEQSFKYKHKMLQSQPPKEPVLTPMEMQAPFFPMMQKTTDDLKAKGKKPMDTDALPIFRSDPKNPIVSFFSMIPMNVFNFFEKKK